MKTVKRAYHHGDLRNALVEQAMGLLTSVGLDGFSLREAARLANVSPNAAYRHFSDRSDLLTEVAAAGFKRLTHQMQKATEVVGKKSPAGLSVEVVRFKALGRAYVRFALDNPELFRVMFSASGRSCLQGDTPHVFHPTPYELLGEALDALVVSGSLAPERRVGAELNAWTVVHGFATLVLDGNGATHGARQTAHNLESLLEFAVIGLCGRTTEIR
jgi:AcrR family transcriptional regulator